MTPRIIIHIGPPKTATTSLQMAFEQIKHHKFQYGGVFQPRNRNTGSLCDRIYSDCSNKNVNPSFIDCVKKELTTLVDEEKTILISEEMFLLEQDGTSIRAKIKRLKKNLEGFDCQILISARPGRHALPSLYQEIFNSLPLRLQIDFSAFCRDKRAFCYDYTAVCNMLSEAGFGNIKILEFDKFSTEGITPSIIAGFLNGRTDAIKVAKANTGRLGRCKNMRSLPGVSLKSIGRFAPVRSTIGRLGIANWPGFLSMMRFLDIITLRAPGERNLQVAEDVATRLDKSYRDAVDSYGVHEHRPGANHT